MCWFYAQQTEYHSPFTCAGRISTNAPIRINAPSKTLLHDPQHNLSRQHNQPTVHLETHITFDSNNNLRLFLQCKITGSRLAQAHKHTSFPGRAVNYWVPAGKLGKHKDDKTPGAYNTEYRQRGLETKVSFLTASSTASAQVSQHPLGWKVFTQYLLWKYCQEVQQVKVNHGPVRFLTRRRVATPFILYFTRDPGTGLDNKQICEQAGLPLLLEHLLFRQALELS